MPIHSIVTLEDTIGRTGGGLSLLLVSKSNKVTGFVASHVTDKMDVFFTHPLSL